MAMIATEARSHTVFGAPALLTAIVSAFEVRKQRAALKTLDAGRLADLGLTHDQAAAEARRPSWDAPAHWKR